MTIKKTKLNWKKKINNCLSKWQEKQKEKELKNKAKKTGYVAAIFANIVLIYIFNNLLNWKISFLSGCFIAPLYLFNISFVATIISNIVFLVYEEKWFRTFCQIILNIIGIVAIYTLYIVFPFNFSKALWEQIAKIVIIFGIIGIFIGTAGELIKLIFIISKKGRKI